jgi:hypothetical protein
VPRTSGGENAVAALKVVYIKSTYTMSSTIKSDGKYIVGEMLTVFALDRH